MLLKHPTGKIYLSQFESLFAALQEANRYYNCVVMIDKNYTGKLTDSSFFNSIKMEGVPGTRYKITDVIELKTTGDIYLKNFNVEYSNFHNKNIFIHYSSENVESVDNVSIVMDNLYVYQAHNLLKYNYSTNRNDRIELNKAILNKCTFEKCNGVMFSCFSKCDNVKITNNKYINPMCDEQYLNGINWNKAIHSIAHIGVLANSNIYKSVNYYPVKNVEVAFNYMDGRIKTNDGDWIIPEFNLWCFNTEADQDSHLILVEGENVWIHDNEYRHFLLHNEKKNVDCEPIYFKAENVTVERNFLENCTIAEGAIMSKGAGKNLTIVNNYIDPSPRIVETDENGNIMVVANYNSFQPQPTSLIHFVNPSLYTCDDYTNIYIANNTLKFKRLPSEESVGYYKGAIYIFGTTEDQDGVKVKDLFENKRYDIRIENNVYEGIFHFFWYRGIARNIITRVNNNSVYLNPELECNQGHTNNGGALVNFSLSNPDYFYELSPNLFIENNKGDIGSIFIIDGLEKINDEINFDSNLHTRITVKNNNFNLIKPFITGATNNKNLNGNNKNMDIILSNNVFNSFDFSQCYGLPSISGLSTSQSFLYSKNINLYCFNNIFILNNEKMNEYYYFSSTSDIELSECPIVNKVIFLGNTFYYTSTSSNFKTDMVFNLFEEKNPSIRYILKCGVIESPEECIDDGNTFIRYKGADAMSWYPKTHS